MTDTDDATPAVDSLPTLTDVLELGRDAAAVAPPRAGAVFLAPQPVGAAGSDLVDQVLAALQPRVAALLEVRLREALAPALARAADGLIRDARAELAPVLRDLVEEVVAQALRQPR
jgi:hypothetical protein